MTIERPEIYFGEIDRTWRDPELLAKALPAVVLQTAFFLAPLLMTVALTFQKTKNFQLNWTWSLDTWTDIFTKPHYWTILGHMEYAGLDPEFRLLSVWASEAIREQMSLVVRAAVEFDTMTPPVT